MPLGESARLLTRGSLGLCDAATQATRLPSGHPEGFIEAFANIYLGVAADIRAKLGDEHPVMADYPRVEEGARGVRFIEMVLESSRSQEKWTSCS
jgi:hypothetical protein